MTDPILERDEHRNAGKNSLKGTISACVQPSNLASLSPNRIAVSDQVLPAKALPFYLCLEDYQNGLQAAAWIPESVGRLLLRSDIVGLQDADEHGDQILEYWCEETLNETLRNPLSLNQGCWVIPAARMAECSDCITLHMKRFVRLCEEALGFPLSSDSKFNLVTETSREVQLTLDILCNLQLARKRWLS